MLWTMSSWNEGVTVYAQTWRKKVTRKKKKKASKIKSNKQDPTMLE